MKKILITGANSYIGMSFENYIKEKHSESFLVDTVDMIDGSWREKSFRGYDAVFHVAGIAHQKETKENAPLYYKVNCDLAIETAKKAKADGVGQFLFLSSMSVYGVDSGVIDKNTIPSPKSNYGKSKYQAELEIKKLSCDTFKVCILRPPMVYGDGCKGNYQSLVKFAQKLPVFPNYKNMRSMIHIDNLSSAVYEYISREMSGIFTPQDSSYVCTSEMVREIGEKMGKKVRLIKLLNPFVYLLTKVTSKGKKAFGSLVYEEFDIFVSCE